MLRLIKTLLRKLNILKDHPKPDCEHLPFNGEYVIVGNWPFESKEEFKHWQKQCDEPYNPMALDLSICIPNGYVDREGQIWRLQVLNRIDYRGPTGQNGGHSMGQNGSDYADQHGIEGPNGN